MTDIFDSMGTTTTTEQQIDDQLAAPIGGYDATQPVGPMADASSMGFTGLDEGPSSTAMIQLRSTVRPYSSGAFPSWTEQHYTMQGLQGLLGQMTEAEVLQLKQRMWYAGLYDEDGSNASIYGGGMPTDGTVTGSDMAAWTTLLTTAASTGSSVEDTLETSMNQRRGVHADAAVDAYDLPGAAAFFQKAANSELGRELTEAEIEELMLAYTGPQEAGPEKSPEELAALNRGEYGVFTDTQGNPIEAPSRLTGGGPDSTAIQFGKSVATSFGLAVVEDFPVGGNKPAMDEFAEGRGVRVAGTEENLTRLHDWANEQLGEGKLFGQVQMRYDDPRNPDKATSVAIVVNQGAPRPNMSVTDAYDNPASMFLDAVRRPGPAAQAYGSWEGEGSHRRGAYGMSDQIWDHYTSQLGIETADTSKSNQDRVATAYAQDLYKRYGNWEDVALAFRKNETEANKRNEHRRYGTGSVDDWDTSEDDWARQAVEDMGNRSFNRQYGGPMGGMSSWDQTYGQGAIPYADYSDSVRSNDPRWQEQRLYNAWKKVKGSETSGTRLAMLLMDIAGNKQISSGDYS